MKNKTKCVASAHERAAKGVGLLNGKTTYKKWEKNLIIFGTLLFIVSVFSGTVSANAKVLDYTEGGHLETDFGVYLMAEWWYLNGKATLVAEDGEKKDIGFFVVLAHQESPMITVGETQLSQLLNFHGLYSEDGATEFGYEETHVPRYLVDNYIAFNTTYVDYKYPEGVKKLYGAAKPGYDLEYVSENMTLNLSFKPNADKTVDYAGDPLNFTVYERSYGKLKGSVILRGKRYKVTHAEGYMDHMIPLSKGMWTWPMDMHGWNWFEVTTKKYQAVLYAVRGLNNGYDEYSYKHLTILNRHNGKVIAEYSGDEVKINESDWINESTYNRKRPSKTTVSTDDGTVVSIGTELVNYFDTPADEPIGFVDFMSYQPSSALIQYKGKKKTETGSSFSEYLVSDYGVIYPHP